jgi:hypothetical protein
MQLLEGSQAFCFVGKNCTNFGVLIGSKCLKGKRKSHESFGTWENLCGLKENF